jgi:hypothetical protein
MSEFNPLGDKTEGFDYKQFIDIDIIKEQSSIADALGIPTLNRFVCLLNAPPGHAQFKNNGWLEFQVLDVTCPNFGLAEGSTVELNGIKRYYFMGRNDIDLEITFLETPDLLLRRFFYNWLQLAANVSSAGVIRNYLEDYVAKEFLIFPLDYKGRGYMADKFINVFPYEVGNLSYGYGKNNDVLKTTIKFKSMFHHMIKLNASDNYHISTQSKNFQ